MKIYMYPDTSPGHYGVHNRGVPLYLEVSDKTEVLHVALVSPSAVAAAWEIPEAAAGPHRWRAAAEEGPRLRSVAVGGTGERRGGHVTSSHMTTRCHGKDTLIFLRAHILTH